MTIILPTDFSDNAKYAQMYAINMFGKDVRYVSLNTFELHHHSAGMIINLDDVLKKDATQDIQNEIAYIKQECGDDVNIEGQVVKGDIEIVIDKIVRKEEADFVVMGTKGADSIADALLGSTTSKVIKHAGCPVLAVPDEHKFDKIEKIVLAVDLKSSMDYTILDPLKALARGKNAEIQLLHVDDDGVIDESETAIQEEFAQYLGDIKHSLHAVQNAIVGMGIQEFVEQEESDLLAMISKEGGFFYRVFHRSETRDMAMYGNIPLIVFHQKD